MQSHDERDMEGFAARREREGVVREFSAEEITGRHEGEELDAARVARLPEERSSQVRNVRADVAGAVSKIDEKFLAETLSIVKKSGERREVRAHFTLTADRAQKLALHKLGVL